MRKDAFAIMLDDYLELLEIDKKAIKRYRKEVDKEYIFAAFDRISIWVEGERDLYNKLIGLEKEKENMQ